MISQLNYMSNSWTRIYKLDLSHPLPDQSNESYFTMQLDGIVTEEYKKGFHLKAITHFEGSWILVFTPNKNIGENK